MSGTRKHVLVHKHFTQRSEGCDCPCSRAQISDRRPQGVCEVDRVVVFVLRQGYL